MTDQSGVGSAINLLAGVDLAADAAFTGAITRVDRPGWVRFVLDTATVAGTNSVVVEGDDTADFSGTTTRRYCTFEITVNDDDQVFEQDCYFDSLFIRVTGVIGVGGDATATTLKMYPPHYLRTRLDSADVLT